MPPKPSLTSALPFDILVRIFEQLNNEDLMKVSCADRSANAVALYVMLSRQRSSVYQARVLENQFALLIQGEGDTLERLARNGAAFWAAYDHPQDIKSKALLAAVCLANATTLKLIELQQQALKQVFFFGSLDWTLAANFDYLRGVVTSLFYSRGSIKDSDRVLSAEQEAVFYSSVILQIDDADPIVQRTAWKILELSALLLPVSWLTPITSQMLGKIQVDMNFYALNVIKSIALRLSGNNVKKVLLTLLPLLKTVGEGEDPSAIMDILEVLTPSLSHDLQIKLLLELRNMIQDKNTKIASNASGVLISIFPVLSSRLIKIVNKVIQDNLDDPATTAEILVKTLAIIPGAANHIIAKLNAKEKSHFMLSVIHRLFHSDETVVIATRNALEEISSCELSSELRHHATIALQSMPSIMPLSETLVVIRNELSSVRDIISGLQKTPIDALTAILAIKLLGTLFERALENEKEEIFPLLIQQLEDSSEVAIRREAILALITISSAERIQALIDRIIILLNDNAPQIRVMVIGTLPTLFARLSVTQKQAIINELIPKLNELDASDDIDAPDDLVRQEVMRMLENVFVHCSAFQQHVITEIITGLIPTLHELNDLTCMSITSFLPTKDLGLLHPRTATTYYPKSHKRAAKSSFNNATRHYWENTFYICFKRAARALYH